MAEDFERLARPTVSNGTSYRTGQKGSVSLSGWDKMVRDHWPDLPADAPMVIIPKEDFDVLVEATRNQAVPKIREWVVVAPRRQNRD